MRTDARIRRPVRPAAGVTRRAGLGLTALAAVACAPDEGPTRSAGATPAAGDPPPIFDRSGRITVYRGVHTVYHSDAPLPTAAAPRADGKATLVWFSQPT
jgi:hypothetical protein